LRAVAVGRKNWTFAGSDEGGRRAAAIYMSFGVQF
jgi:transposase